MWCFIAMGMDATGKKILAPSKDRSYHGPMFLGHAVHTCVCIGTQIPGPVSEYLARPLMYATLMYATLMYATLMYATLLCSRYTQREREGEGEIHKHTHSATLHDDFGQPHKSQSIDAGYEGALTIKRGFLHNEAHAMRITSWWPN